MVRLLYKNKYNWLANIIHPDFQREGVDKEFNTYYTIDGSFI